jgi:hypothetical protein
VSVVDGALFAIGWLIVQVFAPILLLAALYVLIRWSD